MHHSFQKLFARLELQRKSTLNSIMQLDNEQLNFAPEGKWSIAQIFSHIIAAETMSLQYIKKKIHGVKEAEDTGIKEEIKMILLKWSQRLPGLKFKAPKQVVETTTQLHDFATIKSEWDTIRSEYHALLETIPNEYINRKIYKHVRVGYLNMKHALVFFREHIGHHLPQIKKLL
ncbi:hypothetical protein BH09BAC3_BH09BAC3_16680 [soil metagenome]